MIARVASLGEVIANLPAYKTEVQGKTLVVYVRDGEPAGVLVLMEQARQLDGTALQQCTDSSVVQEVRVWVEGSDVWVDLPQAEAKVKASAGFGLGAHFAAELQEQQQQQPVAYSQPCVPQPWMGTYGEKIPVMPADGPAKEQQGIEWQRAHGAAPSGVENKAPERTQMKLSSMWAAAPLRVEPMDF